MNIKYIAIFIIFIFTGCSPDKKTDNNKNFRKLVDKDASFIGKNLKVNYADAKWNWFIPDLDSIAQQTAKTYKLPSSNNRADYVRSYELYGDIGYVWKWMHNNEEILLIYHFYGENGYIVRTLINRFSITIDEAILAIYFEGEFSNYLTQFSKKYWETDDPNDDYDPDSFAFTGESYWDRDPSFKIFNHRVMTIQGNIFLSEKNHKLCRQNTDTCIEIDGYSTSKIVKDLLVSYNDENGVPVKVKVTLNENGSINKILAGGVYVYENEQYKFYPSWEIPTGFLGKGSKPFILESEIF